MTKLIPCSEIRKGMVFKFENEFYECIDFKYHSTSLLPLRMTKKIDVVTKKLKKGEIVKTDIPFY